MTLLQQLGEAVRAIEARTSLRPQIGLVLGSGLGAFAQTLDKAVAIPYRDIPHFPLSTAIGHAGELVVGLSGGVPVAVMAGRVHHYEGYRLQDVVFEDDAGHQATLKEETITDVLVGWYAG